MIQEGSANELFFLTVFWRAVMSLHRCLRKGIAAAAAAPGHGHGLGDLLSGTAALWCMFADFLCWGEGGACTLC